jgi:hypothetical protein
MFYLDISRQGWEGNVLGERRDTSCIAVMLAVIFRVDYLFQKG